MHKKNFGISFISVLFFVFCFFSSSKIYAATLTSDFVVTGGSDASTGTPAVFTSVGPKSDIVKLDAIDNNRIQSNAASWSVGDSYEENKYIEFLFSSNIPTTATIKQVTISHKFRRSGSLGGAKLEVWDGTQFTDMPLTTGTENIDHTDTVDVTSFINTPEKVNALKVRFLAYRGDGHTKTSHDFIGVHVVYTMPDIAPVVVDASVNLAPTVQDQSVVTGIDTPVTISLQTSDPENDPLAYSIIDEPTKGWLGNAQDRNVFIYTPNGILGTDMFSFKVSDGFNYSSVGYVTITNTPGKVSLLSIDTDTTNLSTKDTSTVTIYGQDSFGNVSTTSTIPIIISATGDAVVSQTSTNLNNGTQSVTVTKPTSGSTTIQAVSDGLAPVSIDLVFTAPIENPPVVIPSTPDPTPSNPEPITPPVVVHTNGGHPPIEPAHIIPPQIIENTPPVNPVVQDIPSTPKPVTVPTISHTKTTPQVQSVENTVPEQDTTTLAATAETSTKISYKTGLFAGFLIALMGISIWRLYKKTS